MDFAYYKHNTIARRIKRRMVLPDSKAGRLTAGRSRNARKPTRCARCFILSLHFREAGLRGTEEEGVPLWVETGGADRSGFGCRGAPREEAYSMPSA